MALRFVMGNFHTPRATGTVWTLLVSNGYITRFMDIEAGQFLHTLHARIETSGGVVKDGERYDCHFLVCTSTAKLVTLSTTVELKPSGDFVKGFHPLEVSYVGGEPSSAEESVGVVTTSIVVDHGLEG